MVSLQLFLFVAAVSLSVVNGDKCLPGTTFHKNYSSPASEQYPVCDAWSKDTCCTANFTNELHKNRVRNHYNFDWGHCKNLSKECEKYILAEECFFWCEPRLITWHTGEKYYLNGIPVCSDFCDDWYNACENDQTCVENWLNGFNYTSVEQNCPADSKCRTFKEIYGSGKGLCNKMWGDTFVYSDKEKCPCTRLDREIPENVKKSSTCSGKEKFSASYLVSISLGFAVKAFYF